MKFTPGRFVAAGAVLLVVVALVVASRPDPLVVETAAVSRGPLESTVDADGRTRVRQRFVVVAPVAGRVERLTTREGTAIRAGDIVARIAPMPLDQQSVAQARSRVDAALALAREAGAHLRLTRAALDQRRRDLARARALLDAGALAPRAAEDAELSVRDGEEMLAAAGERARAAEADVRQARAALLGTDGGGATAAVRAPTSGRVLRVPERSERIVAAGTPLIEIGDPRSLEIVVDVLSSDGAMIRPGHFVRLGEWSANAEEQTGFAGRVREVEPAAFTRISALGVDEQRVNVIVDVDEIPSGMGDGFHVEASIVVWSAPDVTRIPASALLRAAGPDSPGDWTAFVVRNGRAERRPLHVGHIGGGHAEVLDGVRVGDTVIVFPSDQVLPGTRVAARK